MGDHLSQRQLSATIHSHAWDYLLSYCDISHDGATSPPFYSYFCRVAMSPNRPFTETANHRSSSSPFRGAALVIYKALALGKCSLSSLIGNPLGACVLATDYIHVVAELRMNYRYH